MMNRTWEAAIKVAPAPERVRQFLAQLEATPAQAILSKADAEQCRILAALLSGSAWAGTMLLAHPEWVAPVLDKEFLAHARQFQGLRREVEAWLAELLAAKDYAGVLRRLRAFKQREMVRIAARDLARLSEVVEITGELSNLADVCLRTVGRVCWQQLSERYGTPYHQDPSGQWQPTNYCVLGLGKLGGRELNYSSDVDVMFVYDQEGGVFKQAPKRGESASKVLSNHQFFVRLAELFVAEVGRTDAEGQLYRIDLRLRPEGKSGPLARSLESCENFYAQWGQTWERMMLIKARGVAGDEGLAAEFGEMIQPFRYPRSISPRFLPDITAMKRRIEEEVVREGELDRNVKLGRGGIREIEFIAQTRQLLHAGTLPFLQGTQTLPMLQILVRYNLLEEKERAVLTEAYRFLRDVEHRLQMENNQQTHTIPQNPAARERLARLMGFKTLRAFETQLRSYTGQVRAIYDRHLGSEKAEASAEALGLPAAFEGQEAAWQNILQAHSFREPQKAVKLLQEFVKGPGFIHVSNRTEELAWELLPKLLALCPKKDASGRIVNLQKDKTLSDPDRVVARLDSFVAAYGSRANLYELWTHNPALFELVILLFDRSEFLAETAIRTPDLLEELMLSGRLRRGKSAEETLADLRHGAKDADQKLWLRRYHEAEFMRLGLREILGLADLEQNLAELSALADACLQYALEVVLRRHKLKQAPFAIIGLGKLGGAELTYGSDLDIVFVAPDKTKNLPKACAQAAEVMDLLSGTTEQGLVFRTDARLRPDGEKGLLVNTLAGYEKYYRQRARLWEIQALTRVRAIAGEAETGRRFIALAEKLANFKSPSLPLAAYTADWKAEIARMRQRIEKERTPAGKDALAIKTGSGGLIDVEFMAQALCLEQGMHRPNTLAAWLELQRRGVLPEESARMLIENYRQLRRVEGILRRWSYEGETELPDDPAPFYRVAVRCGFATPAEFAAAVAGYRQAIRLVYKQVFSSPMGSL